MDIYSQIAAKIKDFNTSHGVRLFPATVKSVDGHTCTIAIGDMELTNVRLRSVINTETDKVIITPAVGSVVLVADLSGLDYRELVVLGYSEPQKVDISIGQTTISIDSDGVAMNGGNLDGLVKIEALTSKLNDLVGWCKNHTHGGVITAVSGGSGAPAIGTTGNSAPPTTQPANFSQTDYEDTNIKH